ncbi:hypothetical protein JCM18909_3432 [Cutibacterium acnes JCM 18909]|nr:hypothetical protein JCM18909_3432 [Cutibacterium acnes JCM 18909]
MGVWTSLISLQPVSTSGSVSKITGRAISPLVPGFRRFSSLLPKPSSAVSTTPTRLSWPSAMRERRAMATRSPAADGPVAYRVALSATQLGIVARLVVPAVAARALGNDVDFPRSRTCGSVMCFLLRFPCRWLGNRDQRKSPVQRLKRSLVPSSPPG